MLSESSVSSEDHTMSISTISRDMQIENPCKMYVPKSKTDRPTLDLEKFNALQTISHANGYQIGDVTSQKHSVLYETLKESFSVGEDQNLQRQIVRKYLLSAQHEFFELTKSPSLIKIAALHGDLLDLTENLEKEWEPCPVLDFCLMLLGETFDLYSSTVSQICSNDFWNQGKPAEDALNNFITKEMMNLRVFETENLNILSKTLLRRCIEKAPETDKKALLEYAQNEGIAISK